MAAAPLVDTATPYPWPWHGALDPARVALLAFCAGRRRADGGAADDADELLDELALAVRGCGGLVVAIGAATPFPADAVVPSRAQSAFYGTPLDGLLRGEGRTDLLLAGWGLEGPVHSTMRAANDRGYECLLVPDACHAVDPGLAAAACSMVMHSGGIFGAYAPAQDVITALGGEPLATRSTTQPRRSAA